MVDAASVLKSSIPIRYASLAFLFVFLIWQLNTALHPRDWVVAYANSNTTHPWIDSYHSPTLGGSEVDADAQSSKYRPLNESTSEIKSEPIPTYHEPVPSYPKPSSNVNLEVPHPFNPIQPSLNLQSRIAKVTSLFYDTPSHNSRTYERALLTHRPHNHNFGYPHYVQRMTTLGPWSKHSYLFSIIVAELAKPPAEQLEWLFWHDADTILMNSMIPLETFLPPATKEWEHINFLAVNDLGGLNDGVFFVRVCDWSASLFAAAFSFPYYRPTVPLRNDEQGALGLLIRESKFKPNTIHVPQGWFNPYQSFGEDLSIPPEWHHRLIWFEPGDMMVHFPGTTHDSRPFIMEEYFDRLTYHWDEFNFPLNETRALKNATEFWKSEAKDEARNQDEFWRHYHLVRHDVGPAEDSITRAGESRIRDEMNGQPETEIDTALNVYREQRVVEKMAAFRKAKQEMLNGTRADKTMAE